MTQESKVLEEKKIEIQQDKLDFQKSIVSWSLAIVLMLPTFIIGFSEMYLPKYPPKEWFILLCQFSFGIGIFYFFEKQVRYLVRFIPLGQKKDKEND